MNGLANAFLKARRKAEANLRGFHQVSAYTGIGFSDPWLVWHLSRAKKLAPVGPPLVLVLQDWGENLSARAKSDLRERGLRGRLPGDPDRTLAVLEKVCGAKIYSGEVIVFNAVWAFRNTGKTGYLGDKIHKASFPVWIRMISALSPRHVCLCGAWAKFPETKWNAQIDGDKLVKEWKHWVGPLAAAVEPEKFRTTKFSIIPHPSGSKQLFEKGISLL